MISLQPSIITCMFFILLDQTNSYREIIYGYHVAGGQSLCSACSLSHCLRMCTELATRCQAVDYNWQHMSCYMHDNTTACQAVMSRVSCAHYKRTKCGDTGRDTFYSFSFSNIHVLYTKQFQNGPKSGCLPSKFLGKEK